MHMSPFLISMFQHTSIKFVHRLVADIDDELFADRNRKVSFSMFGGAQKEKTKFHEGVESAGKRR